jgi:hypothetical protein
VLRIKPIWLISCCSGVAILSLLFWSGLGQKIEPSSFVLVDASGRRLGSLFDGLPTDPAYPELKKLLDAHHTQCGRNSGASARMWQQITRLSRLLGLNYDPVVHAQQSCGGCGYQLNYTSRCYSPCPADYYEGYVTETDNKVKIEGSDKANSPA